jgi:aminoglycoside/choline kinase family phosphotransferase
VTGRPADESLCASYAAAWNGVFDRLDSAEKTLVLRDFHSPNLIWRAERAGHDRLGLIDFQDAAIGPAAYDVASLAMDARVDVAPELEHATVEAYCAARAAQGGFDRAGFDIAYAAMAAQRNSKILGIFVRLNLRDGKPGYMKHLPRIRDYVSRALAHPALAELRTFYEKAGML